jgi:hypothetical protein
MAVAVVGAATEPVVAGTTRYFVVALEKQVREVFFRRPTGRIEIEAADLGELRRTLITDGGVCVEYIG